MPRNMSFRLTTEQIRNRTKTVTRRIGWKFLKPGDVLNACVKCQGLKKGEKVEKMCQIRVKRISAERWGEGFVISHDEVIKEGFPEMSPEKFMIMFLEHHELTHPTTVRRIEFEYIAKAGTSSPRKKSLTK